MSALEPGQLVRVGEGAHPLDGIVFDLPSNTKVIVAVVDPARGPGFRTVDPASVSEREDASPQDGLLKALIRRTPPPSRSNSRGPSAGGSGRPGFKRGAAHRSTGR